MTREIGITCLVLLLCVAILFFVAGTRGLVGGCCFVLNEQNWAILRGFRVVGVGVIERESKDYFNSSAFLYNESTTSPIASIISSASS